MIASFPRRQMSPWLAALPCLVPMALSAAEPVFLRGYKVTPEHVVFGTVEQVQGGRAEVNLGYAHGLQPGLTLLVVRTVEDQVIPVGGLFVLSTEEDHARARVEGPFALADGDFVLIRASRLRLWGASTRQDRFIKDRVAQRQQSRGYSTLNASPQLFDEVARDDEFQRRQYIPHEIETFRPEVVRKNSPLRSRLGAVAPQVTSTRTGQDEAIAADETLAGLTSFVTIAQTPALLRERLTLKRLHELRPLDPQLNIDEENAGLVRHSLVSWTDKALRHEW